MDVKKNNRFVSSLLLMLLLIPNIVNAAAGGVSGTIRTITVKETGYLLITLNAAHANPTACLQDKLIAIANNHIAKKEILSVVLSAHATNKPVSFWITGCYEYYGTSYPNGVTAAIYNE